jgi:hypothetical protein
MSGGGNNMMGIDGGGMMNEIFYDQYGNEINLQDYMNDGGAMPFDQLQQQQMMMQQQQQMMQQQQLQQQTRGGGIDRDRDRGDRGDPRRRGGGGGGSTRRDRR